ncbi:MAG: hypothetical protein CTY16_04820 [Methylobacter sp.]|nr:MAG: hypothetical protein CTY16_04820 [Methylobacter sp.]
MLSGPFNSLAAHWKQWHLTDIKKNPINQFGVDTMSKEQKSNKEDKKKPALSPKEKKALKKTKKDSKD